MIALAETRRYREHSGIEWIVAGCDDSSSSTLHPNVVILAEARAYQKAFIDRIDPRLRENDERKIRAHDLTPNVPQIHRGDVVVDAGGIVAFSPTEVPFHRRAKELGNRDLFGELREAAREDGLAVLAR